MLEPVQVDPHSGYRYYATTQIPTAQVIRRFRDLGMPVREVGEVLATTDPVARSALIANISNVWRVSWTAPGLRSSPCDVYSSRRPRRSRSNCEPRRL